MLCKWYYFLVKNIKLLLLRTYYRLPVMDGLHTLRYIQENSCSFARYGDGEFDIMLGEGGVGFQDKSEELREKLKRVLQSQNEKLLIGIPWSFNSLRYRNKKSKTYWKTWATEKNRQRRIVQMIWRCCGKKCLFGDSQITRPYIAMASSERAKVIFPLLKELWEKRDVLIVEGKQTRMGVGNDLFSHAASVERILAPSKNAFDRYDDILNCVKKTYRKDQLVIIALGPTATVLASDLADWGIQALDIGHIDLEYEWFLAGVKDRVKLDYKYVNELPGGDVVSDCGDPGYLAQIIERIT